MRISYDESVRRPSVRPVVHSEYTQNVCVSRGVLVSSTADSLREDEVFCAIVAQSVYWMMHHIRFATASDVDRRDDRRRGQSV